MFHGMELFDVARILVLGLKWLVYTGLLWGMLRVQKLNYNLLGLFGSSLLATLVALIPVAGSYLSYAVLIICLWKCTGADIAPDITFTVGISGALMFCVNLFVIGALMGRLRPDLASDHGKGGSAAEQASVEEEEDFDETADGPAPTHSHASPSAGGQPRGTPARAGAGSVTASARSGPAAPAPSSPFTIKGTSFGTARPFARHMAPSKEQISIESLRPSVIAPTLSGSDASAVL